MTGDSEPTDRSGAGVRRRHSSQYDDEEREHVDNEHDGVLSGTRIVAANSDSITASEQSQHVRFSLDALRQHPSKKRRTSDDDSANVLPGSNERYGPYAGLSIDTRAANVMSDGNASRDPTLPSPVSVVGAPVSLRDQRENVAPASPLSPRQRNRGMSLRSSLFARNIDRRSHAGDSIIEMSPVGASNSLYAERPGTAKKNFAPSVAVTSVAEEDVEPPTFAARASRPVPRKAGVQGVSALPNYQRWLQTHARRHLPIESAKHVYQTVRKFVLRIRDIPPSKNGRHIFLDPSRKVALVDERTGKPYIGNTIRSSKYNAFNFVPRQLFAQFSKLANFYFLCVSVLQMIPGLSTTGTFTTIIPLLFFVSLSMAKEGYEDLRRHRLDKADNNREAKVLHAYRPVLSASPKESKPSGAPEGPIHWAPVKWHSLQVGDVVRLDRDEAAPADLVLLSSTGPNNIAYIETMALDGETNLKSKQPSSAVVSAYRSSEAIAAGGAHFVVEDPNLDLYNFHGKVTYNGETAPLSNNEIIYRGSVLRNTPEAVGMVIYSGEECKMRMNANKDPRIKAPSLQTLVNKIVVMIVIFVVLLSVFNTVAYEVWQERVEERSWYLASAGVGFGPILTSFIIMFNTMIPLSLYVSLEIIKVAQMFLLNDVDMYDEASDTPFEARTSTINEELGQVGYIFSDKTGTLTENVMRFRKLSVAGTAWFHDVHPGDQPESDELLLHKKRKPRGKGKERRSLRRPSRYSTSHDTPIDPTSVSDDIGGTIGRDLPPQSPASRLLSPARPAIVQPEASMREMLLYIQRRPNTVFARKAKIMILSIALCHTCLPERSGDDDKITFQASSPDELALVQAAQELGFLVYERDGSTLILKCFPNERHADAIYENYEILDIIEFSSKRRRMSVVVRFPDGRICIICKGADSVIMQRLRLAALANQKLAEIETRANQRKSMEAQQALQRKSSQIARSPSVASIPRASMALARHSMSRPSTGRLAPIRDQVDEWLNDRERDVGTSSVNPAHYSPRPSAQIGRTSTIYSERQGSIATDIDEEALVDETLAMDDAVVVERCFQHITDFATEGLRTLLYGHRFLDTEEYWSWKKIYHDATTSLVDRQDLIEKAGELIEQQLELGGATAIEDKLQKGVPETIDRLRRANIKIWMLTGDKRETAINIGQSCRLIKDYSSITVLDYEAGDVEHNIAAMIIDINGGGVAHSVVVIDGQTLAMIDTDESLRSLFLELAVLADSVLCCRASPSQKASLVNAVRTRVSHSVTLAIGDGANDIAMIQEAHVGIGITGKEGLQAARTSDYSIAQFRFLTKLLLVHGRWNYIRTCKYTVGTFWKEFLFYLTQALYQRSTGYTGTSLYESWSLSMFNTLFTSLPVIFLGIFEQDLRSSTLIAAPELYTKGQRSAGFNLKVYLGWMFMAASEAMVIYYTMWGLYASAVFTLDNDLYAMGDLAFTACVVVIVTKLQIIEQRNKSVMAVIAFVLAVGGWFLWNIILSGIYKNNNEYDVKDGFLDRFGRNALWWLTLILTVAACLLFELGVRALKAAFFPTDVETFQALEKDLEVRKRFEEASAAWLQAGWQHGTEKSSAELHREAAAQEKREDEVQELLDRPRVMEEGRSQSYARATAAVETEEQVVWIDDGPARRSTDIRDMLSRRFGSVKRENLA